MKSTFAFFTSIYLGWVGCKLQNPTRREDVNQPMIITQLDKYDECLKYATIDTDSNTAVQLYQIQQLFKKQSLKFNTHDG